MPPLNIQHDGTIDIALGRNRKETSWKNREMTWSALVAKLQTTHRTPETHAEYMAAKKTRQDEIKDIGGFVGGYLNGGRRKPGNVLHRQLITLDADYAHAGLWDDFSLSYGCAGLVYSTHKHTPEHPRLRLVIPLSRAVMSDEYIAIARRVAGNLGIEYFDNTGFQPYRLMYWPSTSKNGEYLFEFQDGAWLDADEVLATYHNWKDSSEWPVSERYGKAIDNAMKKQGDPTEKPGVVGAFCRVYSIEEAIETFLSDVYEPVPNSEDRYTYKEGSTAGGLVVYEGKFAYSHHSTDPISEKLCNAFDLVRIHKFGHKDDDVREGTPGVKLPSYTSMIEYATQDVQVKKLIGIERFEAARNEFTDGFDDEVEAVEDNNDWLADLEIDGKSNYLCTINNVLLILNNDKNLKGRIAYNKFENREVALKNLPWRKVTDEDRFLVDTDDAALRHYLEMKPYQLSGATKISDALAISVKENAFHPVRDYLNNLSWDGKERIDTLFINYLGAEDNAYIRAVTRKAIVAAVYRVFEPGTKFDNMLTLIGDQGIGKSTILNKLGGKWFSDSFNFNMLHTKEAAEQLQGAWIVEVGELTGLKKVDMEAAKNFLSKREDRYRVAYGKRVEYFPRQCVFFGSTNNRDFLRDSTGNRRFWPIDTRVQPVTKNVFRDFTTAEINQVWAEAVQLYRQREPLHLSKEIEELAVSVQRDHTEKDDRAGMIQKYLETKLPDNWDEMNVYARRGFLSGDDDLQPEGTRVRGVVCVAEIWCEVLGGTSKDMNSQNTKFIHDIMQSLPGWAKAKGNRKIAGYGYHRAYYRVQNVENPTNAI